MNTKPLTPWKSRDTLSAAHLQEGVNSARAGNLSATGADTKTLPNGTIISLPRGAPLQSLYLGMIWDHGPNGEADFPAETYWVWAQYPVMDQWGTTVDLDNDNPPDPNQDMSNVIFPVTNFSERQPGGPVDAGTHSLPVGLPIFFFAVRGRCTSATDTKSVQRFVTFTVAIGNGQYKFMVDQMVAQNKRGWDYTRAQPMPGT